MIASITNEITNKIYESLFSSYQQNVGRRNKLKVVILLSVMMIKYLSNVVKYILVVCI